MCLFDLVHHLSQCFTKARGETENEIDLKTHRMHRDSVDLGPQVMVKVVG